MQMVFFALLLSITLPLAQAADINQKPTELQPVVRATTPYSSTTLTWALWDVYDIALWTDTPSWSKNQPYAISVIYKMNFASKDIVDKTVDEMSRISDNPSDTLKFRSKMAQLFPDVQKNDRITAVFLPEKHVKIYHNGRLTGDVKDDFFWKYFSAIWLSDKTSEPKVRSKLLKGTK